MSKQIRRIEDVPWLEPGLRHVWLPYAQMKTTPPPLPVVGSEGVRLELADGRILIDGIASWWTACHGYNHPHIRRAVERQLEVMPHVMFGGLTHEPGLVLAARLAEMLPGDLSRVFFSESGSVSVEIAMKMALQYQVNRGAPERRKLVAFLGGYHGDTLGAMSVCDPEEGMHGLFQGLLPEHHLTVLPRDEAGRAAFEATLDAHAAECAALIVEPLIQGAGGMRFHEPEVLREVVEAARARGLLVIFDEIFTGFGRTGTMFACEQAGVVPDVMTLSKSLTGGTLPLAVTVASDRVFDAFWSDDAEAALMHGPTFMANPLGCAAARASLDLFEREPRIEQVRAIESQLAQELAACRKLLGVVDVRVKGAVGVVQLAGISDLDGLKRRFVEEGVWIRPFGDIVYLTPAFTIEPDDLSRLTRAITHVLSSN